MAKTCSNKRIFLRIICSCLVICLLLSSCGGSEVGVRTLSSVASRMVVTTPSKDASRLHYASSREAYSEVVATSGLIELRLDRDSNSFAVYDTSSGVMWTSLPVLEDAGDSIDRECPSSLVTLRASADSDVYVMNSGDNSFAFGTANTEITDNGIIFTFDMFPDDASSETASPSKSGNIGFRVKLTVKLSDGNMTADCTYENITGKKDAVIEELEILNFFGAYNDMSDGNFLLVPDGCGAIVKTSVYDESFESLSFPVYGSDPSVSGENLPGALVASFGAKRGAGAFAALVEKGDAAAVIKAEKAADLKSFNRVYSSYTVTPTAYDGETLSISKTACVDEIKLCYRFLSANNANYAGMASAVREQLIRNGALSIKTAETSDYLPFFVTVNGVGSKSFAGISYDKTLTDFDQAYDMVVRMKNKGINNVYLNYVNALSGGVNQKDLKDAKFLRSLGSDSSLSRLYEYMTSQKMELYIGVDILSAAKGISNKAENIYSEPAEYNPPSEGAKSSQLVPGSRELRKISDLKSVIIGALSFSKEHDFSGYCITDAGSLLYSDFSKNGFLRQDCAEMTASAVSPLSTSNSVMISSGNFYMLKNADSVINLPMTTGVAKSGAYMPVPFVQIILHGFADYAGEPVNLAVNEKETLLRCVEYGACPHYIWNYNPIEGSGENDPYYYDNTINSAADFYTRAHSVLNDLRDARITDHYEVKDGIFRTEYDNGAIICVNYTEEPYELLGATVESEDFVRVN